MGFFSGIGGRRVLVGLGLLVIAINKIIQIQIMKQVSPKAIAEFSISTQSPVSFSSIALSPIPSRSSLISSKTTYKSPNTSPINSASKKSTDDPPSLTKRNPSPKRDSFSSLSQKLSLKEKQIRLLEEENKRLTKLKTAEKWEKELITRNQEVRKLEFQVNYYKSILRDKVDSAKLLETVEAQSKKIVELEILLDEFRSGRCTIHEDEISELKSDNIILINQINQFLSGPSKEDWENLMKKLKNSEKSYEFVCNERNSLMEEIQRIKKELPPGSLVYFSQDISRIRKEVNKLAKIASDVQNGKEISLKNLLGIENEYGNDPAQQLCKDIQCIKQDLNCISNIISDVLAGHCAEIICRTQ